MSERSTARATFPAVARLLVGGAVALTLTAAALVAAGRDLPPAAVVALWAGSALALLAAGRWGR